MPANRPCIAYLGAVFLVLAWVAPAARAGGVYRCMVDGIPTFASKPIKGQSCKAMAHAPPPPTPAYQPRPQYPTVAMGQQAGRAQDLPRPAAAPGELPPLPPMALPPDTVPPTP